MWCQYLLCTVTAQVIAANANITAVNAVTCGVVIASMPGNTVASVLQGVQPDTENPAAAALVALLADAAN